MGFVNKDSGVKGLSLICKIVFLAWGSFKMSKQILRQLKRKLNSLFVPNWACHKCKKIITGMFVSVWGLKQEGGEKAGTFITLKSKIPGWNALSEKLYIYVYTHIHIYTYIQGTTYEYLVVKKYRLFYNNSTIEFIIIHSNFLIHTVVVEIGTPALSM